jgi:hypothetical protein
MVARLDRQDHEVALTGVGTELAARRCRRRFGRRVMVATSGRLTSALPISGGGDGPLAASRAARRCS